MRWLRLYVPSGCSSDGGNFPGYGMVTTSLYAEYFVFRGPMFTCSMSHDMKDTQRMPSAHIPSTKYGFSGVRLVAYLRCDADFFPPVTLCPETCGCPAGDCISSVSSLRLRAKAFSLFSVSVTSSDRQNWRKRSYVSGREQLHERSPFSLRWIPPSIVTTSLLPPLPRISRR